MIVVTRIIKLVTRVQTIEYVLDKRQNWDRIVLNEEINYLMSEHNMKTEIINLSWTKK
jgi:hypothetical protein